MASKLLFLSFSVLISLGHILGQDSVNCQCFFPSGITIGYGFGKYCLKDEYISKEKYSGTLPYYSIEWARKHDKYVYLLDMSYRNANNIKNYNVTTTITQFNLNQDFLYRLGNLSIFQKDLYLWLGPSTEFFFFYNDQNIAVSGFDYAQSFAGLLSLGISLYGIYPLRNHFQLESSLQFTVISLGFRMVDNEENDQSPVKFLSLFSGLNSSIDLGARYYLFDQLSLKLAYKFELTRISTWESMLSASDNLIFKLTYSF